LPPQPIIFINKNVPTTIAPQNYVINAAWHMQPWLPGHPLTRKEGSIRISLFGAFASHQAEFL
jgi:hypothetical protein